jgi:hypothetical protein
MNNEELLAQNQLYFRMQLLQAEIEMQGMIAENQREQGKYGKADFDAIVEKFGIHHNRFPVYGER